MKKAFNLNWTGTLTIENLEQVADLFRQLLSGSTYVSVVVHERDNYKPRVTPGQRLKNGAISSHFDEKNGKHAGFTLSDTYGVWSFSTSLKTEQDEVLGSKDVTHIWFNGNQVTVEHFNGFGKRIYWVFTLQEQK